MERRVFGSFLLPGLMVSSALLSSCENIRNFKSAEDSGSPAEETEEASAISMTTADEKAGGAVALSVDRLKDRFTALLQVEVSRICRDEVIFSEEAEGGECDGLSSAEPSFEENEVAAEKEQDPAIALHKSKRRHGKHAKHQPQHMGAAYCGTQFLKVYDLAGTSGQIEINDLMPGENMVSVSLIDRFGQVMQFGSADAYIVPGQITPVTIQLSSEGGVLIDVIPEDETEEEKKEDDVEEHTPREPRMPLTWKQADITLDPSVVTSCKGPKFIAYNEAYGLWVGAVTCNKDKYKLVLSKSPEAPFYEIADTAGHGQDHCELVNPKFRIFDDDDIKSGDCADCELGEMRDPVGTPAFVRSYAGEDFVLTEKTTDWGDLTVDWYQCGVAIGK